MMQNNALVASLLLVACGVQQIAGPAPSPAPPAKTSAAPEPPTAPAPTASAATVVTPSPFHELGELPTELTLYPAGERGFLASSSAIELVIAGDDVIQDPLLQRGLPAQYEMFSLEAVAGRWPDALWLSSTHPAGRSGFSKLWSWNGKEWRRKQETVESHFIIAIQPWIGGRLLAVEQAGMMFDASFRVLSGDQRVTLPQFTRAKRTPELSFCVTRLRVEAFAALPSGEIFAAGERCGPDESLDPAVERWAAGAKQGTIDVLPATRAPDDPGQAGWQVTALTAFSPTDVYLAAEKTVWNGESKGSKVFDYFAHFDGKLWTQLPPPLTAGIHQLWSQSDGVLWAVDREQELWSRSAQGQWARVPLPPLVLEGATSAKVQAFWPRAPGDAWAIVRTTSAGPGQRDHLLHTRPATGKLPSYEALARKDQELRLPGPPLDWCTTPFVLLYTLGRKAPAAYDYPATRLALKGHREFSDASFVEFTRDGRRYFGAKVPDFKLGRKLATVVKDNVPGSTPELVCHDPLESRQLSIDLATGELKP